MPPSDSHISLQRTLVLDYLTHHCYTNTARAFARDSSVRQVDADGDELMSHQSETESDVGFVDLSESALKQLLLREQIRSLILSGRIDDAIDQLNAYFPQVLSMTSPSSELQPSALSGLEYVSSTSVEPDHILLNLRILAFIEACRTVPLEYPPSQVSPPSPAPLSKKRNSGCLDDPECLEQQTALLKSAQKLYALANVIQNPAHRATYLAELSNVGGLLAYKVPEESPVAKYLTQERREAVAEQVNSAILYRLGRSTVSYVELYTRYTSTIWSFLHDFRVKPPPNALVPPTNESRPVKGEKREAAPPFDLRLFLDSKP